MGTIRFIIRKDVTDEEGKSPIHLIYQLHGKRLFFTTNRKTYADNWDQNTQRVVYIKKGLLLDLDVKKLNNKLAALTSDIEKIETRFQANGIIYTPEMVMEALKETDLPVSKKDTSGTELFAFIDQYITNNTSTRVRGSLSVYKSLKAHLQAYEKKASRKITFDKIDYSFFESFQNFLVGLTKEVKNKETGKKERVPALNNITIAKLLSTLKTFLNYARAQQIEVPNKYQSFKIKRQNQLEITALTRQEFETLYNLDLSANPAWAQVRDVFCFSCVTGLRYSDLKQLKRVHIKTDHIELTAIKTKHRTSIPLNPYSIGILKKYADDPRPLPVISNQKSNEHLNAICKFAGFDNKETITRIHGAKRIDTEYPRYELIRMHCGRKTFATLSLESGMSAEHVMKLGGWTDYKSFQRYINVTNDSLKGAMELAWGKIKTTLKAV